LVGFSFVSDSGLKLTDVDEIHNLWIMDL